MRTFLPRALQPYHVAGRGWTSNPIGLSQDETSLLRHLNSENLECQKWLIKNGNGWSYRIPIGEQENLSNRGIPSSIWWLFANVVSWSSAVALGGNMVLVTENYGEWARVSGIPMDAAMTIENINRTRTPYWVHKVITANMFPGFSVPIKGSDTYSLVWEITGRENDYPKGGLWINRKYLRERLIY